MGDTYRIAANGVLTYDGNLRIGTANYRTEVYTDEEGRVRTGPTALLALWRVDTPSPPEKHRVVPGQTLTFEGYEITVAEIDGQEGSLEISIARSASDPPCDGL
jgi:hypothetical protein